MQRKTHLRWTEMMDHGRLVLQVNEDRDHLILLSAVTVQKPASVMVWRCISVQGMGTTSGNDCWMTYIGFGATSRWHLSSEQSSTVKELGAKLMQSVTCHLEVANSRRKAISWYLTIFLWQRIKDNMTIVQFNSTFLAPANHINKQASKHNQG